MTSRNQNIHLVGMPGAGKSTIGKALARQLDLAFVDADQELVERTGATIATIFELEGEAGFRTRETTLIAELCRRERILLATGGGAVMSEQNRQALTASGVVIYLNASLEHLWRRTHNDSLRPLLQGTNPRDALRSLLDTRDPLYRQVADLVVETGRQSVGKLVQQIVDDLSRTGIWPPGREAPVSPVAKSSGNDTILQVSLGERSYPIVIGQGLLSQAESWRAWLVHPRVALVTNDTVWPLYGMSLENLLKSAGISVLPIVLPDGEAHKDWSALSQIFDALLTHRCDRQTTLIALGGGVIGDIAGFAAATYQRGVPFIQIPTTLLAQVDSSVGGKTAINHPLGKNMIGAFYQPQRVLTDTDTLKTLPDREYRSGLAEVIKYGLILDAAFFVWLETNLPALLDRDGAALAYAIKRSCEIKADVVAGDERETAKEGGRALLNLGHTFGHAIESALGYGVWLHGEAVGCGMALAARLSHSLGMLDAASCDRAIQLIERAGLATQMPAIDADEMLVHMGRDKKNEGGAIRLILLRRIGEACVDGALSASRIADFLKRVTPAPKG